MASRHTTPQHVHLSKRHVGVAKHRKATSLDVFAAISNQFSIGVSKALSRHAKREAIGLRQG